MMRWLPVLLLLASTATAKPRPRLVIPIVEATSPADHPPRSIFGREGWRPEQLGRVFVRLVPQAPFQFGGMELDNCSTKELEYWFLAGGRQLTPSVALEPVRTDDLVLVVTGVEDLCLSNARILDDERKPYELVFSEPIVGRAYASSTLAPETTFHPMRLFDDDLAHAWSTSGHAREGRLEFEFDEEITIDGILVWNGYQRSESQFRANARATVLSLRREGHADVRLELGDTMAGQSITLPEPVTAATFSLAVEDIARGKRGNNLAVSELRFVSGDKILTLDRSAFAEQVAKELRSSFQKARLQRALDRPLRSRKGTLFLWSSSAMVAATRTHLVHGSIAVKRARPSGVVLNVVGTLRDLRVPGSGGEAFTGQITLEAVQDGGIELTKSSSKYIPKGKLEPAAD